MPATKIALSRQPLTLPDDLALLPIASAAVSRVSVYATLIVAARLLDAEQFGAYAVCLVVAGILSALVTGGGDMWLNRFTAELASVTGQAPRLWPVYFVIVLIISAFLLVIASLVEVLGGLPELFVALVLATVAVAVLVGMSEALLAVMRAGGAVRLFFITRDILAPIGYLVLLLWFQPATAKDALYLYVLLWGAGFVAVASRLVWRAPLMLPAIKPPAIAWLPVVRHTMGLIYGNLTSRLSIYVDVLILTTILSMTLIGEYRVAAQFAIGFMVIQHFVFLGLPWQMRRSHKQSLASSGLVIVVKRQRILLLLAALGGIAIAAAAHPLLELLGDRFVGMVPVFRLLLLTRFVSLLWGPQHEVLVSNGLPTKDAHANVLSLAVWVAAFMGMMTMADPLKSAIVANILSAVALHTYRMRILRLNGLPEIYGHGIGASAPIVASAVALVLAFWMLPG